MTISEILKDTNYNIDLLQQYESDLAIEFKEQKSGLVPYITCKVRK